MMIRSICFHIEHPRLGIVSHILPQPLSLTHGRPWSREVISCFCSLDIQSPPLSLSLSLSTHIHTHNRRDQGPLYYLTKNKVQMAYSRMDGCSYFKFLIVILCFFFKKNSNLLRTAGWVGVHVPAHSARSRQVLFFPQKTNSNVFVPTQSARHGQVFRVQGSGCRV